jgi:hypothetical protein
MSQYHITKDGKQIGPMAETEILAGVRNGQFAHTDLVWKEGTSDWQQLATAFPSLHGNMSTNNFLPQSPAQPSVVHVVTSSPPKNPGSVIRASWILLALCCLGSLLPGIGFLVWVIVIPVLFVTLILGILAISRGGTVQGILILIASLIAVPIFVFIAPIITTGAAIEASEMEDFQN